MGSVNSEDGRGKALGAGNFYGAVEGKYEQCGAIFTNLRHALPKKLPMHAHELAFFALLLEGEYGERYERQDRQFRPFTIHFRPAGIPHQDEVGPRGVRFFEMEIRPCWWQRLADDSAALDLAHDDSRGGPLLWLGMKMYREFLGANATGGSAADELLVESLLAEMLGYVARMRREKVAHPPTWLGRVIEKLTAEYSERLTLDELSIEAGVHPVHLSRVFRKFVREGIGERVHRLRIRAACEQMLTRELSMAEISLATGYADQSHFTRAFRRATGMTPAAFRRQLMSD
ncbi:MAG TPA: AraC family transcriptional regulator [Terriglobales bacterium]